MEFYCPFTFYDDNGDAIPKKKTELDGYTEFDASVFEGDGMNIGPSDAEIEAAQNKAKSESLTTIKKKKDPSGGLVIQGATQIQESPKVAYIDSYSETNNMLRNAIIQTDVLASEIKEDLDKIRASTTMKSKYTYITNLTSAEAGLIGTKVQAIREINNSISKAHDLELKRAKDIKDAQREQQSDDARMMDMYNAFINSPMGMYNNALNMPTVPDMMLGTNGMSPSVRGVSITSTGGLQGTGALTPEQMRMRMEGNPNIEEVVMYEPSTGRRWFEVIDSSTGTPIPNYPKSDDFLLADCTIDVRAGVARNRNIDKVWRLVNTENTVLEY